jgi:N-hydroxyarylamine O-acetyltransferase
MARLGSPSRQDAERHFGWQYRVTVDGGVHVLQSLRAEGWFDLYSFTLEEQHASDYEVSIYFTSTNRLSRG